MHVSTLFPLALQASLVLAYQGSIYARNAGFYDDYDTSLYAREAEAEADFDYDLEDIFARDAEAEADIDYYDFDNLYTRAILEEENPYLYAREPPKPPKRQNSAPSTKPEKFRAGQNPNPLNPSNPVRPGVPPQPPHRQNTAPGTKHEKVSANAGVSSHSSNPRIGTVADMVLNHQKHAPEAEANKGLEAGRKMDKHYNRWGKALQNADQAATPAEASKYRAQGNWNRLLGSHYQQQIGVQEQKMDAAINDIKKMDIAGVQRTQRRRWLDDDY